MGIFDAFKKKKELTLSQQKENRMWDLWVQGKSVSPYTELMTYESDVNNGGHSQYFFNIANCHDLKAAVDVLFSALPGVLRDNLQRAYDTFSMQEEIDDDVNDELFQQCDDVFWENEQLLLDILQEYAESLTL